MLKIWLGGDWVDNEPLKDRLAAQPSLFLVGDAELADAVVHLTDGESLGEELARLREHARGPVVVVARSATPDLLDAAFEADVAELLLLPQSADAIAFAAQKAVAATARRDIADDRATVATVFSPKGGTGKSVIACNLADTLARQGRRVLLVDLDLQFGDVAIMLGIQPERTIHELLTAPGPLDAEKIAGYATRRGPGLDILAAPLKPEDAESISDTRVGELIAAARGGWDVVIVDTAPFFHGPMLTTLDRTDVLLTVCTPDVPAMKNVRLALQTLRLLSFPEEKIRVVLNRANEKLGFRGSQVASILEHDVAVELPEDQTVSIAINRAETAGEFAPASPFAGAIPSLVRALDLRTSHSHSAPRRKRFAIGRRG